MSAGHEYHELQEQAEHGRAHQFLAPASITMAIIAVLVATVSLLGHRAHTEEVLLQNKSTDQWAYYQAKNLRRNNLEALDELMSVMEGKNEKAETVHQHFEQNIERYRDEQKEIEKEAHALEAELQHETRRADRFDLGEVFLEVALVITSITLLTGRKLYWRLGIVFTLVGVATAASVLVMR